MKVTVPFLDLKAQYLSLRPVIDRAIQGVVESTEFIGGAEVRKFEEAFAAASGVSHVIGVANGTDALYVSLKALGVGPGDEVITAANSFIASSEAITLVGATPVFVDCDSVSYNIDIEKLESTVVSRQEKNPGRLKAILPVHLYGRPANMRPLMEIAAKHDLVVVEDAAQAHLARYEGRPVGTFGHAACFSFYPGKNLGAYGDAGAVVTRDGELARKIRMLANHGRIQKYDHELEGTNSRLDALQAAVLSAKLPFLAQWNARRYHNAVLYRDLLASIPSLVLPEIPAAEEHTFHLFVVRVPHREQVQAELAALGIATGVHYPIALPNLRAYRYLEHSPEDFPIASRNQGEILSLPMYPELTEEQIRYVADSLKKALAAVNSRG